MGEVSIIRQQYTNKSKTSSDLSNLDHINLCVHGDFSYILNCVFYV